MNAKRRRHDRPTALVPIALLSGLSGMISSSSIAQSSSVSDRLQPSHTRATRPAQQYNIKWGKALARFSASAQIEASDNINLSDEHPEGDLGVGPRAQVGLFWPITQANRLEMDFGVGYRYYLDHPAIQSFDVTPESHLDYDIFMPHGRINLHDSFGVEVDPTTRADLSGSRSGVEEFRRFQNDAGLTFEWQPGRAISLVLGYDFQVDRSISGAFSDLNLNSHQAGLGGYYEFDVPATLGLRASFSSTHYPEGFHNDNRSYTFGPSLYLDPTPFIHIDASFGYSLSEFDSLGTLGDDSEFRGFTGQLGVRHRLNRRFTHELGFGKSFQLGLNSNFSELLSARYSIHLPFGPKLELSPSFIYEHYKSSATLTEIADRYLFQVRSGWQFGRRWSLGAAYSFVIKESNLPYNDYSQNRFTLDLSRQF